MEKMNEKQKLRIRLVGLSIFMLATGIGVGRFTSKNNNLSGPSNTTIVSDDELVNGYLNDYIEKRDALEKEIASLLEQKQSLQNVETFNMDDLIVMENTNENNESNLYILCGNSITGIFKEYHDDFNAWYRLHPDTDEHISSACASYIHFNECQPLFNYLTDEEIETLSKNGGEITTTELDEILARIRGEYKQQLSENDYSKRLTNN